MNQYYLSTSQDYVIYTPVSLKPIEQARIFKLVRQCCPINLLHLGSRLQIQSMACEDEKPVLMRCTGPWSRLLLNDTLTVGMKSECCLPAPSCNKQ